MGSFLWKLPISYAYSLSLYLSLSLSPSSSAGRRQPVPVPLCRNLTSHRPSLSLALPSSLTSRSGHCPVPALSLSLSLSQLWPLSPAHHIPRVRYSLHFLSLSLIFSLSLSLSLTKKAYRLATTSGQWHIPPKGISHSLLAQFPLSLSLSLSLGLQCCNIFIFFSFFFSSPKMQVHVQACNHPYTTKFTVSNFYFCFEFFAITLYILLIFFVIFV
jgi:hypothetical protein